MPKIIVTIDKFGTSKVSVEGETGDACIAATASIEAALAGSANRTLKSEYDDQPSAANSQAIAQSW
jgi:hypothetical protein